MKQRFKKWQSDRAYKKALKTADEEEAAMLRFAQAIDVPFSVWNVGANHWSDWITRDAWVVSRSRTHDERGSNALTEGDDDAPR